MIRSPSPVEKPTQRHNNFMGHVSSSFKRHQRWRRNGPWPEKIGDRCSPVWDVLGIVTCVRMISELAIHCFNFGASCTGCTVGAQSPQCKPTKCPRHRSAYTCALTKRGQGRLSRFYAPTFQSRLRSFTACLSMFRTVSRYDQPNASVASAVKAA
jgi:hypothetical protein